MVVNILLWILQILLAVHTAVGAVWKFYNPAQTVPSLGAIPPAAWLAMSIVELLCGLGLLLPLVYRPLAFLIPLSAILIGAQMLLFCGLHVASGDKSYGPVLYWLVVAAFCAFIAGGRLWLRPL